MAMTMASPTVASPAATAITNSAMTEPLAPSAGVNAPNATMARFTPLSISSMHISMAMALRLARKPKVPMLKSSAESTR